MQTIQLDISNKGVVPTIYAKQGDVGRKFLVVLTDSGIPYAPPAGSVFSVWYDGTSGEGNYTDVGSSPAIIINANTVEVELITQMLQNEGEGKLCLVLNKANGDQISSWNISYICEAVPGHESEEAKAYFTAFSNAVQNLPYPDVSLSTPGKAADAAAVGASLAGKAPAVEDVNNPGCFYRLVQGVTEWLNPPMAKGVEYRTTERWDGKHVYTKLIDLGALPNAGTKTVENLVEHVDRIVDAVFNTARTDACFYNQPEVLSWYVGSYGSAYINITTNTDMSNTTARVALKYTKTTD